MRSSKSLRLHPVLERLEDRLTPSGNVSVSVSHGNLKLLGDAQANGITISQPAANEITITPDATTTINHKSSPMTFMNVTGSVSQLLGGGDDSVTIDLSKGPLTINGNLTINGGAGNKTISTNTNGTGNFLSVGGNFTNLFGNGTENVTLDQFNVAKNVDINHQNGTSFVTLGVDPANLGKMFNSVGGNLDVTNLLASGAAGTGFDIDALEETNVGGNVVNILGGDDPTLGFAGWTSFGSLSGTPVTVGGSVSMSSLDGNLSQGDFFNDGFEVVNAQVAGSVTMDIGTGAGSSAAFGGGSSAGSTSAASVTINGSGATDLAVIGPSSVSGKLSVSLTGAGSTVSFT
jgi:hypothetical protein